MTFRKVALAAVLAGAAFVPAYAADLAPARAYKIDLGDVNGVAYYTVESGGYHVVATIGRADEKPVRMETTLSPGQSFVLSTPTDAGAVAPARVEISRRADDLQVQVVAVSN